MVTNTVTSGHLGGSSEADILTGIAQNGTGQIHAYAQAGNDTINLDFNTITSFSHGHHVRGDGSDDLDDTSTDRGNDIFDFKNLHKVDAVIVGRIEDFDLSRDTLKVNGASITSAQLAAGSGTTGGYSWRIVAFDADSTDSATGTQQWILINTDQGYVFYALEGARATNGNGAAGGQQEAHFIGAMGTAQVTAAQLTALPTVGFVDPQNYVPAGFTAQGGDTINDDDNLYSETLVQIVGTANGDLIAAGLNNDNVNADNGNDVVWGGSGHDLLAGGNGNDTMWGGTENDTLYGNAGNDILHGGTGNDDVRGGTGNDTVNGNDGKDTVRGEDGNDNIGGQNGNDVLFGGNGNDTLTGANDVDTLWGDAGADNLNGGAGNDRLRGGADRDSATGSSGSDVFEFRTGDMTDWDLTTGTTAQRMEQMDVITDFVIGQDKLHFKGMAGVDSVSDFTISKYTVGTNVYFKMNLIGTNERILVDVADNVTWSQISAASNFIFT